VLCTIEEIATSCGHASKTATGFACCCPSHDDHRPSLTLDYGTKQRIVANCHATISCPWPAIKAGFVRLGVWDEDEETLQSAARTPTARILTRAPIKINPWRILSPIPLDAPPLRPQHFTIEGVTYDESRRFRYTTEEGATTGYNIRFDPKSFRPFAFCQYEKTSTRAWVQRALDIPRPLFGLKALAAKPTADVVVVEGERCCIDASRLCPQFAWVTWPGGARAVMKADYSPLIGRRRIYLWPDCDAVGVVAMNTLAVHLRGISPASTVTILGLSPTWPDKFDVSNYIARGANGVMLDNFIKVGGVHTR
jgi:uncharacterized protein DUF6371